MPLAGHNGGPPLDEHVPEWGPGPIAGYFEWKAALREVRQRVAPELALRRLRKAERLGLTYEEYTLELLERGRHLQPEDTERITALIREKRRK